MSESTIPGWGYAYVGDDGRARVVTHDGQRTWTHHPDNGERPTVLGVDEIDECGCWWDLSWLNPNLSAHAFTFETPELGCVHQPSVLPDYLRPQISAGSEYVPDATYEVWGRIAKGVHPGEENRIRVSTDVAVEINRLFGHETPDPMTETTQKLYSQLLACGYWGRYELIAAQMSAELQYPAKSAHWRGMQRGKERMRRRIDDLAVTDEELRKLGELVGTYGTIEERMVTIVNWWQSLNEPVGQEENSVKLSELLDWQ